MKRVWPGTLGVFAVALPLLLARPAHPTSPESPWILLGGGNKGSSQAVGTLLVGDPVNPLIILPHDNPGTGASGHVSPQGKHCKHEFHYHGQLFGAGDNGQGCGWGAAIPYSLVTLEFRSLADAIQGELSALGVLESSPGVAEQHLMEAFAKLGTSISAVEFAETQETITQGAASRALKNLNAAKKKDLQAIQAMEMGVFETKKVAKLIEKALKSKREAFAILVKANHLLDPPG